MYPECPQGLQKSRCVKSVNGTQGYGDQRSRGYRSHRVLTVCMGAKEIQGYQGVQALEKSLFVQSVSHHALKVSTEPRGPGGPGVPGLQKSLCVQSVHETHCSQGPGGSGGVKTQQYNNTKMCEKRTTGVKI